MDWNKLNDVQQLDSIIEASASHPILLFKHSTRCSISSTALNRFERSWKEDEVKNTVPYYLDLISHRNISQEIASRFGVEHQSPQALLIKNGKCIYNASHFDIQYQEILKHI